MLKSFGNSLKLFSWLLVWGSLNILTTNYKIFELNIEQLYLKAVVLLYYSRLCFPFFCLYRLFHHQTLRCQFLSQCPTTTAWCTVTQSAHWGTPTFCRWLILLCKEIACLLAWHIGLRVQVTQVGSTLSHPFKRSFIGCLCALGHFKLYSYRQECCMYNS